MIDAAAHRIAMSDLADTYFAAQCARLGPIDGVSAVPPRPRPAAPAPARKRAPRSPGLDRFKL